MKHVQITSKTVMSISDAAMDRARRAMDKVTYSPARSLQITQAAQKLPDIAVMAGGKRPTGTSSAVRKVRARV